MKIVFSLLFLLLSTHVSGEPLKVGVIVPLSGAYADYGWGMQRAVTLAQELHPDQFREVRFQFEDAGKEPLRALHGFHKLRSVDRMDVVYTFGVAFCKALAPVAEEMGIPLVGQCIDPGVSRGKRYVIRTQNYTDEYMHAQLTALAARGKTRIAVVVAEDTYTEALFSALQRQLLPGQVIVSSDRFPTTLNDFRAHIIRLKQLRVDAIGVFLLSGQYGPFGRQARELQLALPLFGTNLLEGRSELENTGGAVDGISLVGHPLFPEFERAFTARFGPITQPSFSALAYEFAVMIAKVSKEHPTVRGVALLDALTKTKPPGEATGPCRWKTSDVAGRYLECALVEKIVKGIELREVF